MSTNRRPSPLLVLLAIGTGAVLAASTVVFAEGPSHMDHAHHMQGTEAVIPTMPGQDAFGAIQEIVRLLETDPNTDWSAVNLEALRQHLIDMNDVTLKADAQPKPIEGGLQIAVTGEGRTVAAICAWSRRTPMRSNGPISTAGARRPTFFRTEWL